MRVETRERRSVGLFSLQRTQVVTLSYTEWWDQEYVGTGIIRCLAVRGDLVRRMFFIDRWADAGENYYVGQRTWTPKASLIVPSS